MSNTRTHTHVHTTTARPPPRQSIHLNGRAHRCVCSIYSKTHTHRHREHRVTRVYLTVCCADDDVWSNDVCGCSVGDSVQQWQRDGTLCCALYTTVAVCIWNTIKCTHIRDTTHTHTATSTAANSHRHAHRLSAKARLFPILLGTECIFACEHYRIQIRKHTVYLSCNFNALHANECKTFYWFEIFEILFS